MASLSRATSIVAARLHNHALVRSQHPSAAAVVAASGAVQAQEFPFARWGLGLRMDEGVTDADVLRAFDAGKILRTHVLRPTWHFVAPADIRWMLALTGPRVHRSLAGYVRQHGLDAKTLTRATTIIEKALDGHNYLTRNELGKLLERRGIVASGIRLAFVSIYAELEGVICSGPWSSASGRKSVPTYALVAERAPRAKTLPAGEALAELTRRFFASHGPATIRDFVWWSSLLTADAKRGLDMIGARAVDVDGDRYWSTGHVTPKPVRGPMVRLLPIYDEYLVAYRDRGVVRHGPAAMGWLRGAAFRQALVIDGHIAGTWNVSGRPASRVVEATLARRLTAPERRALETESVRYAKFLGTEVSFVIR